MTERFPNRCQVSIDDQMLAEIHYLGRIDDRSESATIRKLIGIALSIIKQQQPAQPNGAQHQEESHGVGL